MKKGSVAIMQPYIFPYIGYFHLIESSNIFVFYDDVNYMKGGWINRNRILNQNIGHIFTVPVSKISQNKLINEISPIINDPWKNKFYKQLIHNYKKSPFFTEVFNIIESVFEKKYWDISDLSIESILSVYRYLDIPFNYTKSSSCSPTSIGINKDDRLIQITKEIGYDSYVNAIGGKELYTKEYFSSKGVSLSFVKSNPIEYIQYSNNFVPWLSIIDVLMFNEKEQVIEFFSEFSLE